MDKDSIGPGVAGFLIGVFLTFLFGGAWAYHDGKQEIRKEAERRGCGRWIVEDGEKVEFEWLHPAHTKSEGK